MSRESMDADAILSFFWEVDEVRRRRSRHDGTGPAYTCVRNADGGVTLTRMTGDVQAADIPSSFRGLPVTAIAP